MNIRVDREDGWIRFAIPGKDRWTPSTFFSRLDGALACIRTALSDNPGYRILFDLLSLETVDSSLVTIIVQTVRMAGSAEVCVLVENPDVFSLLALLGIGRLAHLYESEEAWRAGLEQPTT